jgi:hypothetical protein
MTVCRISPAHTNASILAINSTTASLPLAFLEMCGATVAFAEPGSIKTHEYTSSGAARGVMKALAENAGHLETDELIDLEREIELLKCKERLDEAFSGAPSIQPTTP